MCGDRLEVTLIKIRVVISRDAISLFCRFKARRNLRVCGFGGMGRNLPFLRALRNGLVSAANCARYIVAHPARRNNPCGTRRNCVTLNSVRELNSGPRDEQWGDKYLSPSQQPLRRQLRLLKPDIGNFHWGLERWYRRRCEIFEAGA